MKKNLHPRFILIATIVVLLASGNLFIRSSFSQSRINTIVESLSGNATNGTGREYWFTMAQNYESQSGKYYELFVTSAQATTVNIQVTGGSASKYPITGGQVLKFLVPLAWEMTSSGVIENKGIRVWSNDADLIVNLLSRNPASSDGMLVIPTTGWGKEYVVASYGSLYEGYAGFVFDYPSEFCIVANQDSSVCTITPSCNIRVSGQPNTILHKAGLPFTEKINRGQCVQYKAILPTNAVDFDLTGSTITSNNSIGLVGASQCPNIPAEFQYCDHICDMIPPVRTWGKTYQTVPFAHRFGGDTYLVIASKAGQIIYRNGQQYFISNKKYEYYFRPDIADASQWTSDAPFMVAQYINSSTWPDQNGPNNAGVGDPAMVVINSVEQYTPHIIFSTPNITNGSGYQNFANVMVHNNVKNKTTFDGQPIASFKGTTQKPIPFSNYTAFTVASLSPGKHEVNSDSGVGVYVYSYSSNDSYAWSGNLGIGSFNDPDTIPPKVSTSGSCFDALVTVTDNHRSPIASKISTMKLDSVFNMAYNPDPTYTEGVERDSTSYAMNVIDITKEAYLKVETFDYAGNRTTITSTYTPPLIISTPRIIDYGMPKVGMTDCQYITFTNHGNTSYSYKSIQLYFGNHGFTIDSAGSITAIPAGDSTVMKICFSALSPNAITDTLELSDGCSMLRTLLAAGHIPPDYIAFGENFKCEPVGSVTKLAEASVENISKDSVTIDSIWVDDPIHFGFIANMPKGNNLPFVLSWNGQHFIEFSFMPDSAGSFSTIAHFHSIEAGERTTTLQGCGINPASVNFGNYPSLLSKNNSEYIALSSRLDRGEKISILPAVPNPVSRNGNISVRFAFGLSEPGVLKLSLYDMLGKEMTVIFNKNYASGIYEIRFALPANLPDGNYIYRLAGESNVLSGKLVILH